MESPGWQGGILRNYAERPRWDAAIIKDSSLPPRHNPGFGIMLHLVSH